MENKIQVFKQLINESNNIVFLVERVFQPKVEYQILEVRMVYIIKNTSL